MSQIVQAITGGGKCPAGYIDTGKLCQNIIFPWITTPYYTDQTSSPVQTGEFPDGTVFSPDLNNWVGYLTPADVSRDNKLVTLGPAPPGMAGYMEGFLLVAFLTKLAQTPEGIKVIERLAVKYLDEVGRIISAIHISSAANPYNCLANDYVMVRIFQRMGLMSAHDAVQTSAWLDHVMGEFLKNQYFSQSMTGLTSMVTGLERQIPTMLK